MRVFFFTALLAVFFNMAGVSFAQEADPGLTERLALAKTLNEVNPATRQVEQSLVKVAEGWGLSEKEKFRNEMMAEMNRAEIEQKSVEVLADVFTKEELELMISYYSSPLAAKITEKMPIYQGLIQPFISKELDRALMKLRTGYEAQFKEEQPPAATP